MCKSVDESKARPDVGCTELLDAQSKLMRFARLFEPVHQEICKHGGTQVHEYMELWHVYKDEVRPILEASNAGAQAPSEAG